MIQNLKKNLLFSIAIGAIIYLLLSLYGDFEAVSRAFSDFNWFLMPLLLLLSLLNYFTRFLKWDYYLKILSIKVGKIDSFGIFMSGLIMSVTPGKMGELIKAYFVKEISGEKISKTAPIILAERITDFISLILLAIIGAFVFDYGKLIVIITGIVFMILTVALANEAIAVKSLSLFEKIKVFQNHIPKLRGAYRSASLLLKPKPFYLMILLSLLAWFFECFGFYIILVNFKIAISVFQATFFYAIATIIGALTMLPAGLGITDGSLVLLISEAGAPAEVAVAATFIIRAVTLWFAVFIGILAVMFYAKRYKHIQLNKISYKE